MLISLSNSSISESFSQSPEGLPSLIENTFIFRGDEGNPLLAPRGVWVVENKLIVADTGQNRIFIWNEIPQTEYARPDVVLGQMETNDTGRNSGKRLSAKTLQYPSGIWSDGKKLIVADAWNHRVLIWNTFPTQNGQAADVVLGQPDFEHNLPNVMGIGTTPSAQSRPRRDDIGRERDGPSGIMASGDGSGKGRIYFETLPPGFPFQAGRASLC